MFFRHSQLLSHTSILSLIFLLTQCATLPPREKARIGKMGGPTVASRDASIASEPLGNYYIGRRYYIEKTRFWGYVRKPRQSWDQARLVLFSEKYKASPDRYPEWETSYPRYGFDHNYEYKLKGNLMNQQAYDPNSNQFLPIFELKDYSLLNQKPGWLFRPDDEYNPYRITIYPRS